MGVLLKFLLIGFLIYMLLKAIGRIFTPGIQSQQGRSQGSNNRYQGRPQEGRIRITKRPEHQQDKHVSGGEYVDFEEVE